MSNKKTVALSVTQSVVKAAPVLSPANKAVATKLRKKLEAEQALIAQQAAYAAMSPGKKSWFTKEQKRLGAAPVTVNAAVIQSNKPIAYADMKPADKAVFTKNLRKDAASQAIAASPVSPAIPSVADGLSAEGLAKLIALAPVLKSLGLI